MNFSRWREASSRTRVDLRSIKGIPRVSRPLPMEDLRMAEESERERERVRIESKRGRGIDAAGLRRWKGGKSGKVLAAPTPGEQSRRSCTRGVSDGFLVALRML